MADASLTDAGLTDAGLTDAGRDQRVVVWGASGKTGRALTAALGARGWSVEGISRRRQGPGRQQWWQPEELEQALVGAAAAWLIAPNMFPGEPDLARRFIVAARRAGVPRVGYHSVLNPQDRSMPHHIRKGESEQIITDGHPDVVVVRPSAYHQNLVIARNGDHEGALAVPYDVDQRFRTVDLLDVAAASAALLSQAEPAERVVELVGPEELSVTDMAREASSVLGRDVAAQRVPSPALAGSDLQAMFDAYDARGFLPESGADSSALVELLGHPATTWTDYLRRIHQRADAEAGM